MELSDIASSLMPLFAKSLLDEQNITMQNILEFTPELDDLIDVEGLEAGEWSYDDKEWRLEDGTTFNPLMRLLMLPPAEFIKMLLNGDSLSLYECLFLLGYARDKHGVSIDMMQVAVNAIIKRVILPRDPETHLRLGEAPEKRFDGELVSPDLTWLLTFEEAETWAVNSFGISLKALRDRLPIKPPTKQPINAQTIDTTEITETERNTMLKLIIGMAIDAYGYNPKASKNTATGNNKNGISARLQTRGINVSDDTIRRILNKAKDIL